jgi:hypothetical protein
MNWWTTAQGATLAQGDLFEECLVPRFDNLRLDGEYECDVACIRLIVITQSCDLENAKSRFVALCPIHRLQEFEIANPKYAAKGVWEEFRKGRRDGLHLLASPEQPDNNREALVTDFGHIISLPIEYLAQLAAAQPTRWRLASPYLEHFSQGLARFFMRVGLSSSIPKYS